MTYIMNRSLYTCRVLIMCCTLSVSTTFRIMLILLLRILPANKNNNIHTTQYITSNIRVTYEQHKLLVIFISQSNLRVTSAQQMWYACYSNVTSYIIATSKPHWLLVIFVPQSNPRVTFVPHLLR